MKTALITGASSGIGFEIAKEHAMSGGNLVLVSRNESKLASIKQTIELSYNVGVEIIVCDLSQPDSAEFIYSEIKRMNVGVDYLINNAGFGDFGFFVETDWQKELQMIHLNIITLTHLTKLFLKEMSNNHQGRIMNIASTAAFQAGPQMAVYFATKAYVLNFSEAITYEAKHWGVKVTTVCPGPTKSGFQKAATLHDSALFNSKSLPSSEVVARFAYRAMLKGRRLAIHGMKNKVLLTLQRFVPRFLAIYVTATILDKK